MVIFYFFFSSRRRHTRSLCDWSSDVCSSDLMPRPCPANVAGRSSNQGHERSVSRRNSALLLRRTRSHVVRQEVRHTTHEEIGRASCRERVEIWVVGVSVKKKRQKSPGS